MVNLQFIAYSCFAINQPHLFVNCVLDCKCGISLGEHTMCVLPFTNFIFHYHKSFQEHNYAKPNKSDSLIQWNFIAENNNSNVFTLSNKFIATDVKIRFFLT